MIPMDILNVIFTIRGYNVMLDFDLATLYGVPTKQFNKSVLRNLERFPPDFMFQLGEDEVKSLGLLKNSHGGRTTLPYAFTENGVAMLSSVLRSPQAIQVNIAIMRTFTRLRAHLLKDVSQRDELSELKDDTNRMFKVVFDRLDSLEETLEPKLSPRRKKIGLK
jgi:hypothetical protein